MKKTTQKRPNGNNLIRLFIITGDFILVLGLLAVFDHFIPQVVPEFFHSATKITFITAFFSLSIAQYYFSTILHFRRANFGDIIKRATKMVIVFQAALFVFLHILSNGTGFFRFAVIYGVSTWIIIIIARFIERMLLKFYRKNGHNIRHVIFIGSDPANLLIYQDMINDPSTGYDIIGYFSDSLIIGAPVKFKRLGTRDELLHLMDKNINFTAENNQEENTSFLPSCDEIFLSLSHDDSNYIAKVMDFCDKNVIHFYYVPRQFGNFRLRLKPEKFFDYTLFTNRKDPLMNLTNRFIKRAFDILFSGSICLLILPFFPIIALIIKIQSPGPIFFLQNRTGVNGENFLCMKFRSMHVNKDADLVQAKEDDPRKFAFGNFMRKTNIDEFPQFINVLKGDMSIVGPRPHMLHHTQVYSELIDKYMVRHFCKPGITGWAQVTGYRGETKELWQMEERVKRDIWYIENWSPLLDIKIIFMTAKSLIIPDKHAY
jgi:putative colanic acid biosynthesis UDP-glucose lipid carrier transferase